ncbi:hypothetical protein GQ53DRAFT_445658 [Thozetella sp. PMI_491]|nr:hypothetical protein GQ53DRAFT_445658 [Thozetella sp. PMI_491]
MPIGCQPSTCETKLNTKQLLFTRGATSTGWRPAYDGRGYAASRCPGAREKKLHRRQGERAETLRLSLGLVSDTHRQTMEIGSLFSSSLPELLQCPPSQRFVLGPVQDPTSLSRFRPRHPNGPDGPIGPRHVHSFLRSRPKRSRKCSVKCKPLLLFGESESESCPSLEQITALPTSRSVPIPSSCFTSLLPPGLSFFSSRTSECGPLSCSPTYPCLPVPGALGPRDSPNRLLLAAVGGPPGGG